MKESENVLESARRAIESAQTVPDGTPIPAPGGIIAGKYQLRHELGAGGMGVVFEAENLHIGKLVAIKLLKGDDRSHRPLARFHLEAKASVKIQHPGIVQVFDMDTAADGTAFIVMERLYGQSLRQRLQGSDPLPAEEVIRIGIEMMEAMAAAHKIGVLHRDVKPANVFLCDPPEYRVKLLDFGISKMEDSDLQITQTGNLVGTPPYMAPEQLLSGASTQASDVYSCGVTLYESLAGHLPYDAGALGALQAQIVTGQRQRLVDTKPDFDPNLSRVIDDMLAMDPLDRPTAQQACEQLLSLRSGTVPDFSFRRKRRATRAGTLAALFGVSTGAVLLAAWFLFMRDSGEAPVARVPTPVSAPLTSPPAEPTAPAVPVTVSIELSATPAEATWTIDGQAWGCNPCSIKRPQGTRLAVSAEAPGYRAQELALEFEKDGPRAVQLVKVVKGKSNKKSDRLPIVTDDPYQ